MYIRYTCISTYIFGYNILAKTQACLNSYKITAEIKTNIAECFTLGRSITERCSTK